MLPDRSPLGEICVVVMALLLLGSPTGKTKIAIAIVALNFNMENRYRLDRLNFF
jgi:hypothetical protein